MTLAETIYRHSLNLPESAAREVLDFIILLEKRNATESEKHSFEQRLGSLTPDQRAAFAYLNKVRIDWNGKPISDREDANAR